MLRRVCSSRDPGGDGLATGAQLSMGVWAGFIGNFPCVIDVGSYIHLVGRGSVDIEAGLIEGC